MSSSDLCTSCHLSASQIPSRPNGQLLLCARCKGVGKRVGYCSRDCQIAHYPTHKPSCGRIIPSFPNTSPSATSDSPSWTRPRALLLQLSSLSSLPTPLRESISYLYWSSSPLLSPPPTPDPKPLTLPPASRALFTLLLRTASATGNQLSVNLMYSLLLEVVESPSVGGNETRLIEQLSEEFGFNLEGALEGEEEPGEEELEVAIGGKAGMGVLLRWQMEEAGRGRGFDGEVEVEEGRGFEDEDEVELNGEE